MIDYKILKQLVIEVFTAKPFLPVNEVIPDVEKLAAFRNLFPSKEDCDNYNLTFDYYRRKRLSPLDKQNINYIIWQLIRDNLMVIEQERLN